jgi:hypothetical protein
MRLILSLILLLIVTTVAASADRNTGGFAVHMGMGSLYGGDGGAAVEYEVVLRPLLRLSPFVAAGTVGMNDPEAPSTDFGYCIGVNAEYGRFHRVFAGPSFGTQFLEWNSDSPQKVQTLRGPSFVAGYRGTARFGLMWQMYLGMAYIINYKYSETKSNPVPAFGFGIGYKF